MNRSKAPSLLKNKPKDDQAPFDSDTSLDKYIHSDDSSSSSSTSTTKSSPAPFVTTKTFLKKPGTKKDEHKFQTNETDLSKTGEFRRPINPLAKPDVQLSFVANSLGNTMPPVEDNRDEIPPSTGKVGFDTLDEEQEKALFFRNLEQHKGEETIDYSVLNKQIELELSPTRPQTDHKPVRSSFDKQIVQMSTPLHQQPTGNVVKESLSNELDRELEHEKQQQMNATTTIKHVTIVEPATRPSASLDDFSRGTKTVSDALSTTSDTTRDLEMLRSAYKQNFGPLPTARTSKTYMTDSKKKPQQRKTTTKNAPVKNLAQTPTRKASPTAVVRPKTAPTPAPTPKSKDESKESALIEELKHDKELLQSKIASLESVHEQQLRSIRQENYILQAKISTLTGAGTTTTTTTLVDNEKEMPKQQREVHELEKLIDGYQIENEKLYKRIKQIEQQHKQIEQSMFDENEKLRQELIQIKLSLEQQDHSQTNLIKRMTSSTIVLRNFADETTENERLKNEIIVLKSQLTAAAAAFDKEHKSDDDTLRSLDQKRIKDLERQVKELELITRRRQEPSSQVAMILNGNDGRNQLAIRLVEAEDALRERQIHEDKLTHELNVLEQKYTVMKQIQIDGGGTLKNNEQLEKRLHDVLNKNKNLAEQVQLRRENERLRSELEKARVPTPKPARSLKRDLETIKLLRTDLERKNDELEKLRALYDAVSVQHKSLLAEREREKTRLAIMGSKPYQPDRFIQALSPIEAVHAENEQLKHLVERLEHDSQQQLVELMHLREDRQAAIAVALRGKDEEIQYIRQQHKSELQKIINEMAANTTEPRISDLMRKIEMQESAIAHLKKLTEHTDDNARELAVLRVRDDELKATVIKLEQELADARAYQTPEMRHFHELQTKINQLEQRWQKRDLISKDYTASLIKQHDLETNNDVHKLRAIIKQKNHEIERFHLELDAMLGLLKTLKLQQLLAHH